MKTKLTAFLSTAFLSIVFAAFLFSRTAPAAESALVTFYKYAHNEAEYSVILPEAPTVETIWGDRGNVPYLDKPPTDGAVGEMATFRRLDMETEDPFEVKIIFLRAPKEFLETLNEEKMKTALKKGYRGPKLTNVKGTYSAGTPPLKWQALTGFSVGKNNQPYFSAMHYLAGQQSILVIRVSYNVNNKTFQDYYKNMIDNISYHAP